MNINYIYHILKTIDYIVYGIYNKYDLYADYINQLYLYQISEALYCIGTEFC